MLVKVIITIALVLGGLIGLCKYLYDLCKKNNKPSFRDFVSNLPRDEQGHIILPAPRAHSREYSFVDKKGRTVNVKEFGIRTELHFSNDEL